MAVISVVEHDCLSTKKDGHSTKLTPYHIKALERLDPVLPRGAIKWRHQSVRFSQYCGVLGLGDDTIEVLPKIYGGSGDSAIARKVLLRMLYAARKVRMPQVGSAAIDLQRHHLLDVFILHFCEELFAQLHEGALLRYVDRSANLRVLRGKLILDQHLKLNRVHKERLYCEYDELEEDNVYNQYIKCALQIAHGKARSVQAKRNTTNILYQFGAVSDRTAAECRKMSLPLNRDTDRFDYVFRQCDWFLHELGQNVTAGDQESLSLMFDMNKLFEGFVAAKIKKMARSNGCCIRVQGQKRLAAEPESDGLKFFLKPDMVLLDSQNRVIGILDTKWKVLRVSDRKKNYGISSADLYQMVAYGMRYRCHRLMLLYPKQHEMPRNRIELEIDESDLKITVLLVDLQQMVQGEDIQLQEEIGLWINSSQQNVSLPRSSDIGYGHIPS